MMQNVLFLNKVTLVAPGADDGRDLVDVLGSDEFPSIPEGWKAAPVSLPPRSRRRLSPQTLLAIAVAENIGPSLPKGAAWVFASAFGEGETLKVILDALRGPGMAIRPLRFQNSVHNAASGQWTIAAGIRAAATSICGGDCTVGVGLLKSFMQAQLEDRPVGLVMYDVPLPFPLSTSHRLTMPAGIGMAFSTKQNRNTQAVVEFSLCDAPCSTVLTQGAQKALETGNPIFAALPFLERIVGIGEGKVVLGLNGRSGLCLKVSRP